MTFTRREPEEVGGSCPCTWMEGQMEVVGECTVWHEPVPISFRCSSAPIECTPASSLNMQWKASTADPLFKALQAISTAHQKRPRGIKRAVLQDWNSPSLKRARFDDCGGCAAPASAVSVLQEQQHPGSLSKRGLSRDDEGARKGMRLSPPSRLHYLQNGVPGY